MLHSIFLRNLCILPDGLDLELRQFCEGWKAAEETVVNIDLAVRRAGWHFVWLQDSYSDWACGRTQEGAIHRSVVGALKKVAGQFNASELESFQGSRYPGFHFVKATVRARQIQQQTSMEMSGAR
jgi:hypothetical protein